MRISDGSSDVCSSDLAAAREAQRCQTLSNSFTSEADAAPCRQSAVSDPASRGAGVGSSQILVRAAAAASHGRHVEQAQIGRASCRERVGQYVLISVVAVSLKKKTMITDQCAHT